MKWLAAAAIILVLGIVGRMDYEDAKQAEQRYDDMVCSGAWPDYDNREPECE